MRLPAYDRPQLPEFPRAIQKGVPLKQILNDTTASYLARNISLVDANFNVRKFFAEVSITDDMSIMARGRHLGDALFKAFDCSFEECIAILLESLTPAEEASEEFGLAGFFYLPHSHLIAAYGLDKKYNNGRDGFAIAMQAQYELTQRFTAEFCIRDYLIERQSETLQILLDWTGDPSRHVRRLCSEGTRPKLPWGKHLKAFIDNPEPVLPILEILKDDHSLYVRRSVANHLGDIAKSQLALVLDICERWLTDATAERKWLIRHALRYPDKKGHRAAHELRLRAK